MNHHRSAQSEPRSITGSPRSRGRWVAVAALAAAATLLIAPSASAATTTNQHHYAPHPPTAPAHRSAPGESRHAGHHVGAFASEDFELNNLTPYPISLVSADADSGWGQDGQPNESKVYTGYASTWWVQDAFSGVNFGVTYQFRDQARNVETVTTAEDDADSPSVACNVTGVNSSAWQCDLTSSGGETVFNLHSSSASMSISPANRNRFAQALSTLCDGPNAANHQATCSFRTTSAAPTYVEGGRATGFTPKGAADYPGCYPDGDARNSFQYTGGGTTSQTASISNSITTSVTAGVMGVASIGFAAQTSWGHAFTTGTSYSDTFNVAANYGSIATPYWYPTIGSASGDFTATLAGTTYTLDDVTINTAGVAGSTGGQHFGTETATVKQHRMHLSTWTQNCGNATPPPWMK